VFNARTKLLLITTPNNPTTHCLTRAELELLRTYCDRFDAFVVSDEVWEQVVFDREHLSVLHLPGLAQRALKIGSAGKIFALTGWKVGWLAGAQALVDQVARAHQFITFSTPPGLQHGVAFGLGLPRERFTAAHRAYEHQRNFLMGCLSEAGFAVLPPQGSYFINIDLKASGIDTPVFDYAFDLIRHHGLATIPLTAFCDSGRELAVLRLCFAKSLATLEKGAAALAGARQVQSA
jgi:aspartate/methionine/tyrosine aminotransferase